MASQVPSLDGRVFNVSDMGAAGEASAATMFEYHEDNGLVWARYQGGAVRLGFLSASARAIASIFVTAS